MLTSNQSSHEGLPQKAKLSVKCHNLNKSCFDKCLETHHAEKPEEITEKSTQ